MKIAVVIVRTLMGLLFLFASITYFFELVEQPEQSGAMKTFLDGMVASQYLLPTAKAIELLAGILFVVGRFVPLATILIAPIIVNIVGVHAFLAPEGLVTAILLALANGFVAYYHRDAYRPLFQPR